MEVVCIETEAFYSLVEQVVERLHENKTANEKWIDGAEAMRRLGIKSTTTLQNLRDGGSIRFYICKKNCTIYDSKSNISIIEKLKNNEKNINLKIKKLTSILKKK